MLRSKINVNSQPLEVVSRYRDTQLQVTEQLVMHVRIETQNVDSRQSISVF